MVANGFREWYASVFMEENKNNTKGLLVQKNSLIENRAGMSLFEVRIFCYLISKISKEDKEINSYEMSFQEIMGENILDSSGVYRNEAKRIKSEVRKLHSRSIEIETDRAWSLYHLFDKAEIIKNVKGEYQKSVIFKISDELKPYLLS